MRRVLFWQYWHKRDYNRLGSALTPPSNSGVLMQIVLRGAGGSTKLVAPGARHGKIERIFNYKYPTEYIDRFDTILARKEGVKQFYDQYPSCGESARPQAHGGV